MSQNSTNGNRLLAAIPAKELEQLSGHLELVALSFKQILYDKDKPIEYVYFPTHGVLSLLTIVNDDSVEVGTVGNEGMVGIPVFLGADTTSGRCIAQIPGEAYRMKSNTFRQVITKNGSLTQQIHRYLQSFFVQLAQHTACNRLHSIEQRCARWLLMTHDRVNTDEFALTQEFLSMMLGVRRASVNEVQRKLKDAGLIRYSRGYVSILDRAGLEKRACECYFIIRDEYEKMLSR